MCLWIDFKSSNKATDPPVLANGSKESDEHVREYIELLNLRQDEAGGYFQQVIRRFQDNDA